MKNEISFRTTLFESGKTTPKDSNGQNFGEDLAKWMSNKAAGSEFDFGKTRYTVFEFNTVEELFALGFVQLTGNAHGVFALKTITRMRQSIGQVARCGEDQQAFGVEI